MNWKFYIKSASDEYVATAMPLDFTTVKSKAFCAMRDSANLDEEFVEDVLMDVITKAVDQSNSMDWKVQIEDEEDNPIADIIIDADKLECAVKTMDISAHARVRMLCTILTDYITALVLLRASKAGFAKMATGGSTASTVAEPNEEEVIKMIEEKTKASIVTPKETLADYVCNDSLKKELEEIVDFFSRRDVYVSAGVRIPKGILFKGIPGTGKTYAARCIAGSTECYFMSCTASSLQGMYVGSGAENVRNIFQGAKLLFEKTGKAVIVFIDEIDSFGNRESHTGGAGSEEDRTLNQLLAEMSGFEDNDNVMVLAATNYPERLDDALMRSGRFSRQISIEAPDECERMSLVEYYYDKLKIDYADDCCSAAVAALTEGMTAADIAEVMNEAGILTIRESKSELELDAVNEAINKCITKNIRKPDRGTAFHDTVAIHEAGHVLAEFVYQGTCSVKVTNYSYGDAGGFTQPQKNKNLLTTRFAYLNEVRMLLGGRAAEEVLLGEISTGASDDLRKATAMLKAYFKNYHFEQYDVSELDQLVEDRLHALYAECVSQFENDRVLLREIVDELCKKRVLYTADICNIIERNTEV